MLGELREDNQAVIARVVEIHDLCDEANDVATASFLENWIDHAQRRVRILFETSRTGAKGQNLSTTHPSRVSGMN